VHKTITDTPLSGQWQGEPGSHDPLQPEIAHAEWPNGEEILPKVSTPLVGCTDVTGNRRQADRFAIANTQT